MLQAKMKKFGVKIGCGNATHLSRSTNLKMHSNSNSKPSLVPSITQYGMQIPECMPVLGAGGHVALGEALDGPAFLTLLGFLTPGRGTRSRGPGRATTGHGAQGAVGAKRGQGANDAAMCHSSRGGGATRGHGATHAKNKFAGRIMLFSASNA